MISSAQVREDDLMSPFMRGLAPYLVLALAVFAAYGNIFDNTFLFDDIAMIRLNAHLRGWEHIGDLLTGTTSSGANIPGGFYRPAQMLLYLFAFNLGGGDVFAFHLLNLSLHIANACLVYKLGTRLGFNARGVFWAALAWGVHPIHTEAISYMSGTADPLYVFFCLSALLVLLPDFSLRKIFLIIPLFLFGLLSKETAVVLPALVMACLFYVSPDRLSVRTYLRTWPLWIIAILFTYWRWNAEGFTSPDSSASFYNRLSGFDATKAYAEQPLHRFFTFLATLPSYLRLLIWPNDLHMERSFPIYTNFWYWPVIGGTVMVIAAASHIVRSLYLKRPLAVSFGLLWFAAAHAPQTGLFVLMNALLLEHWMYLPSIGLFLGAGEALTSSLKNKPRAVPIIASATALALCIALSVATYNQNKVWRDHLSFYPHILSYEPTAARAHSNLAIYYLNNGKYDDAIEHLDQSIASVDAYAEARYNLASAYLHKTFRKIYLPENAVTDIYKQPYTFSIPPDLSPKEKQVIEKVIKNLERSVEIQPDYFRSHQTLGDVYGSVLKNKEKADLHHKLAKEILSKQKH
ncbi:MAG: hypothetical protein WC464_03495 [Bdellovibrionales bacterium]